MLKSLLFYDISSFLFFREDVERHKIFLFFNFWKKQLRIEKIPTCLWSLSSSALLFVLTMLLASSSAFLPSVWIFICFLSSINQHRLLVWLRIPTTHLGHWTKQVLQHLVSLCRAFQLVISFYFQFKEIIWLHEMFLYFFYSFFYSFFYVKCYYIIGKFRKGNLDSWNNCLMSSLLARYHHK